MIGFLSLIVMIINILIAIYMFKKNFIFGFLFLIVVNIIPFIIIFIFK